MPKNGFSPRTQKPQAPRNPVDPTAEPSPDRSGLYRPELVVDLLNNRVRYRPPSMIQIGLIKRFIVAALKEVVASPGQQTQLTARQLEEQCFERLSHLNSSPTTPAEEAEYMELTNALFLNADANEFLLRSLEQCFPDEDPVFWTDEALMTGAKILMEEVNNRKK